MVMDSAGQNSEPAGQGLPIYGGNFEKTKTKRYGPSQALFAKPADPTKRS